MSDKSPEDLAAELEGTEPTESAQSGVTEAVEGSEATESAGPDLWDRLLSPVPDLDLDHPHLSMWDPENGGLRRLKRGAYGFLGTDKGTVLEDLLIGSLEAAYNAFYWASDGDSEQTPGALGPDENLGDMADMGPNPEYDPDDWGDL